MPTSGKVFSVRTTIKSFALVAAESQPQMILPQVLAIFIHHSETDVSLIKWIGYLVLGLPFLFYGIVHLLRTIVATQVLYVCYSRQSWSQEY